MAYSQAAIAWGDIAAGLVPYYPGFWRELPIVTIAIIAVTTVTSLYALNLFDPASREVPFFSTLVLDPSLAAAGQLEFRSHMAPTSPMIPPDAPTASVRLRQPVPLLPALHGRRLQEVSGHSEGRTMPILWTIPGDDARAASYGSRYGDRDAWEAMTRAMFDGWVVRLDIRQGGPVFTTRIHVLNALRRAAKGPGRLTHVKPTVDSSSFFAWWS